MKWIDKRREHRRSRRSDDRPRESGYWRGHPQSERDQDDYRNSRYYSGGYGAFRGAGQRAYGSGAERAGTEYAHRDYGHEFEDAQPRESRRNYGSDWDRSRYGWGGPEQGQGMAGTQGSGNWNPQQQQSGWGGSGYGTGGTQRGYGPYGRPDSESPVNRDHRSGDRQQFRRSEQDDYRNFSDSEPRRPWGGKGGQPRRGRFYGVGPRGYKRSDGKILEDVCDLLARDEEIDASQITVEVKNAVVKLEGEVDNRGVKYLVEDIAENVMGVEEVENRLKVDRHSHRKPYKAGSESEGRARSEIASGQEDPSNYSGSHSRDDRGESTNHSRTS